MKIRIISALLALILIISMVVACGEVTPQTVETTQPVADTSEKPEETTESLYDENGYLKDSIPATTNLGGITLKMLHWSDASADEFYVEQTNGEMVNDAIFDRNAKVEERLSVAFEYNGIPGNNSNREAFLKAAQTAVQSDVNYDLYGSYSMSTALLAYNGLCENILNYSSIDLDKPWWPKSLTTEATIHNKLYFLSGDISTNLIYTMFGLFFNTDLVDVYKLESPYDCVKNNKWTFDTLVTMCAATETSSVSADKIYGFTTYSNVYVDPFFFAAGLRTIVPDSDGNLVIADSFHNEKTEDVAGKVWDLLHQSYSTFEDSNYTNFLTNKALFVLTTALFAKTQLSGTSIQYGIVPVPKYTADQENYTTLNGFTYSLYAISTSSEHKEESAIALECLGSEAYRTITPALFEITMKTRYAESSSASEMFDIIRESITFDIGRIFTSSLEKLTYNIFRGNVSGASKVSYLTIFNSNKKILQKRLDELNKVFTEVDKAG